MDNVYTIYSVYERSTVGQYCTQHPTIYYRYTVYTVHTRVINKASELFHLSPEHLLEIDILQGLITTARAIRSMLPGK